MKRLLLVDDDSLVLDSLKLALEKQYSIETALNIESATASLQKNTFDAVLLDINLGDPNRSGLDLISEIKRNHPDLPVVMISGQSAAPIVVKCMQLGADDFIEKPIDKESLLLRLNKIFMDARKNRVFKRAFEKSGQKDQIVGQTPALLKAKSLVERAGSLRILFHGETGVGKTPFALYSNQIVATAEGQPRPFEQINCAGLNRDLFQDQLYGHKKGAFTGAMTDKRGLVELAEGGDLFLDEIGEMPLDTQALFLTFIDTQEYYRLGDDVKRKADVRILCATNRDLKKMVLEGTFRKDLYSRISQVVVEIPSLRSRPADIPLLLEHFVRLFAGYDKPCSPEVLDLCLKHPWSEGNVRELRDAVEFMCVMGRESDTLLSEHMREEQPVPPISQVSISEGLVDNGAAKSWIEIVESVGMEQCLSAVEKSVLSHFYRKSCGQVDEISAVTRVAKSTLYRRLKFHGITDGSLSATPASCESTIDRKIASQE